MKSRIFALNESNITNQTLIGKGEMHVLVIIRRSEAEEKTFYDLIKAIKLNHETDIYKLIVDGDSTFQLNSIIQNKSISKVVSFGFSAPELGYNINQAYYHSYEFINHKLILSESIHALNTDKNKKISLWKCLQQVFL